MSTPAHIYIDQNVLGYVRDERVRLAPRDDVEWVYSFEHFREISRGNDTSFLSELQRLRARQIDTVGDQCEITDQAILHEYSCPFERYKTYLKSVEELSFAAQAEDFLLGTVARLIGAQNWRELQGQAGPILEQLEQILPQQSETADRAISELLERLHKESSLESIRTGLEVHDGRAGNFSPKEAITQIWALVERNNGGLTIDQFFGVDALDQKRPTFLGIVGAHMILNIVGFRPDRHLAKPEALRASLSDGIHLAHAAFCDVLMSADRRMCHKASAIYSYLGVNTVVAQVSLNKHPSPARAA
jgi:hypothetical protein